MFAQQNSAINSVEKYEKRNPITNIDILIRVENKYLEVWHRITIKVCF